MPTSSAMMTTMLGFLAGVCADAAPLNANGSASAVVARNFLNIDVSLFLPEARADQPRNRFSRRKNRATREGAARSGGNARQISDVEISSAAGSCPMPRKRVRDLGVSSEISEDVGRRNTRPFDRLISYPAVPRDFS